jgi:hypothetical protein
MKGHIAWLCSELIDFEEPVFLVAMLPVAPSLMDN